MLSLLCRRSRTADPVVPGTQSLRDTCNLLAQLRGWHRLRIRGDPPRSGSTGYVMVHLRYSYRLCEISHFRQEHLAGDDLCARARMGALWQLSRHMPPGAEAVDALMMTHAPTASDPVAREEIALVYWVPEEPCWGAPAHALPQPVAAD